MRISLLFIPLLIVLCFSFNSESIAQEILCEPLDDFSNTTEVAPPVFLTAVAPGPVNIQDNGAPGVLGDIREITFGPLVGVAANILISNNSFALNNAANSTAPASIFYDADGAGLGLDLSNTMRISFVLRVNDLTNTRATISLSDSANNTASATIANLPNIIDGDNLPTEIDFEISDFSGLGSLDLSNIQSIEIEIIPTEEGTDTVIEGIEICGPPTRNVPTLSEWGLISLAGVLGIVGLVVIRRKKLAA